jgi:hypothetical protein
VIATVELVAPHALLVNVQRVHHQCAVIPRTPIMAAVPCFHFVVAPSAGHAWQVRVPVSCILLCRPFCPIHKPLQWFNVLFLHVPDPLAFLCLLDNCLASPTAPDLESTGWVIVLLAASTSLSVHALFHLTLLLQFRHKEPTGWSQSQHHTRRGLPALYRFSAMRPFLVFMFSIFIFHPLRLGDGILPFS